MDPNKLIATGLTAQQASAYAMLIEHGQVSPPEAAELLSLSRSNSYKLLDKLVEMNLAEKQEIAKKFVYSPANPHSLSNLVAQQRNIAVAREEAVREVLTELMAKYRVHTDQPNVDIVTGRGNVANAYRAQINQKQPIYFIRSRMDIPVMGFETMHEIRIMPARFGNERFGITPDLGTGTTANPSSDKRSKLDRTWIKQEDYNAPVEWSVSGSSLLIVLFGDEPHAITIDSPIVADAFTQLWHVMNTCLQAMPYYSELPRKTKP
jgi:predicted transcriptional regulator